MDICETMCERNCLPDRQLHHLQTSGIFQRTKPYTTKYMQHSPLLVALDIILYHLVIQQSCITLPFLCYFNYLLHRLSSIDLNLCTHRTRRSIHLLDNHWSYKTRKININKYQHLYVFTFICSKIHDACILNIGQYVLCTLP